MNDHELTEDECIYFRDALRQARSLAFKDAEAFDEIIYVLESIGSRVAGPQVGLGKYRPNLKKLAEQSHLAADIPKICPYFHLNFDDLFTLVVNARNGAMHEGVFARHLTDHTVELALILEHALMNGHNQMPLNEVRHYML